MSATDRPLITRGLEIDELCVERSGDGRTIEARALTYGVPYTVSDDGGRSYYTEKWSPNVFTKSIAQRGGRIPLLVSHDRRRLPIGATIGAVESDSSFVFRAKVSRTRDGDEALELVQDGALTGVSVGARIVQQRAIEGGFEQLVARMEEISLSPFAQMADAHVLAVRADIRDSDDEGTVLVQDPPGADEVIEAQRRLENEAYLATLNRPWRD